jgi:histidinol dehydrogenase
VSLRYRPLRRVGVGLSARACSVSALLASVVPAQAAGVEQLAVFVPPDVPPAPLADLLAAAHALGLGEVYRVGGVPAVAAQAYGVEGIEAVDKIVGSADPLVALACRLVHGEVDASACAGLGELVLLADWTSDPRLVAVDLLEQAAGDHGAALLITWEPALADTVSVALARELERLDPDLPARENLERFGALLLVRDEDQAVAVANRLAPARLLVSTADPPRLAERLTAAGAILLGDDAPSAVADHVAGPSHLLPLGGAARWAAGLSANDFLRRTTVIDVDRGGLQSLAPDLRRLADREGRPALRRSVDARLDDAPLPTSEIDP